MAQSCPVATLQTWLEPAKITDLSGFQGEGGAGEGPGGLRGRAVPDVFRAAGLASHGARTGASRSRLDFRYGMSRGLIMHQPADSTDPRHDYCRRGLPRKPDALACDHHFPS